MVGALYLIEGSPDAALAVAQDFTPRFEICGPGDLLLDLSGLTRLFGDAHALARELQRAALARGLRVGVALAGTATAARLLARHTPLTVVDPGTEAPAVARLPLALLADIADDEPRTVAPSDAPSHDLLAAFRRWGLRTAGDLAALPADDIAARLGTDGLRWHRMAEGRDLRPLRRAVPDERFEQALDLEWPIEGLEPLSFVLVRLLEPLAAHLERRGRGAAVLHLRLHLVTRAVHDRSIELPAPMRDARTLRTLLLLDLESHPAPAAIDRVVVAVDPTPARVLQFSLLDRPLPSTEQISTLMARLTALMGQGRCGSPVAADSWKPGAFEMTRFAPPDHGTPRHRGTEINKAHVPNSLGVSVSRCSVEVNSVSTHSALALRRFRFPVPARVRVEHDRPVRVTSDRRGLNGGCVEQCAGPWRTSGGWWNSDLGPLPASNSQRPPSLGVGVLGVGSCPAWDGDEWDVTLADRATYRIYRDRATGTWFLEGLYD
jgi:protein ImuB